MNDNTFSAKFLVIHQLTNGLFLLQSCSFLNVLSSAAYSSFGTFDFVLFLCIGGATTRMAEVTAVTSGLVVSGADVVGLGVRGLWGWRSNMTEPLVVLTVWKRGAFLENELNSHKITAKTDSH